MSLRNTTANDIEQEKGAVISNVEKVLKNILENSGLQVDYLVICICALELLECILGEDYDFPVNIEKMVEDVGLKITYQPLNDENDSKRLHRIAGKIIKRQSRITGEIKSVILIDEKSTRKEQRYTLAHELTHYLIHYSDQRFISEFRVMPMLFKEKEEMVAEIFAVFLLIPLPAFLEEFSTYIGVGGEVPVKTSEWLQYLSTIASVPYEDVAIGYQNIRYVSAIIYKSLEDKELLINYEKQYHDFYKIIDKHCKKIRSLLDKDGIQRLFC